MNRSIINKFVKHNKVLFSKKNAENENKILIEFNGWSHAHIWGSYLVNCLAQQYNSSISAFEGYTLISSPLKLNFFQKVKLVLAKNFFGKYYKIYKSFGVDNFFRPKITKSIEELSLRKFAKLKKIKTKNQILNIKINNIKIGDLIYDTFLKKYNVSTINLEDKRFNIFLLDCLKLFFFWDRYFKDNKIKAVIVVHSTYLYGVPMRVALSKNIPIYRATYNQITYISKKNYHMGKDFIDLPKIFQLFPKYKKKFFLNIAKKKLENILDYKKTIKLKKISKKKPIMIAMHNFYDSPHVFGNMLFPDFYEWLNYLAKLSSKTNYEWYFKPHPDNNNEDIKIVSNILKKNKNMKILSPIDDYKKILKKGIKIILTCYGTVGYEYAYFGCTVINACQNNPNSSYRFNLNPKTISEYEKILLNISKYEINPDKKKILELFFLRKIYFISNWLSIDKKLSKKFGWKTDIYKPSMYKIWLQQWHIKKHRNIIKKVNDFIVSKKFRLFNSEL